MKTGTQLPLKIWQVMPPPIIAGTPKNTKIPNLRLMLILVYLPGRFSIFESQPTELSKKIRITISNNCRLSKGKNAPIQEYSDSGIQEFKSEFSFSPNPQPATKYQKIEDIRQMTDDRKQISEDGYSDFKSPCSMHHALCSMLLQTCNAQPRVKLHHLL